MSDLENAMIMIVGAFVGAALIVFPAMGSTYIVSLILG